MEQKMFCYQCQETAGCKGCTMSGVCGKKPDVAAMQDLLVYVTKGISAITTALRQEGKQVSAKINHLITLNLFTTITNANFDKESIESRIRATLTEKEVLLKQVTNLTVLPEAAKWNGSENWEEKARTCAWANPPMISPVSISLGATHFFACSIIAEKFFCSPISPGICVHPGYPAAPVV